MINFHDLSTYVLLKEPGSRLLIYFSDTLYSSSTNKQIRQSTPLCTAIIIKSKKKINDLSICCKTFSREIEITLVNLYPVIGINLNHTFKFSSRI